MTGYVYIRDRKKSKRKDRRMKGRNSNIQMLLFTLNHPTFPSALDKVSKKTTTKCHTSSPWKCDSIKWNNFLNTHESNNIWKI